MRLCEVGGQDAAEREAGDGEALAKPGCRGRRLVGHCDQVFGAQLGDRGAEAICVAVAGVARDEDIPAPVMELPAQRVELLGTVGEAVQEEQRPLSGVPVGVKARPADGVHIRAIERFQLSGDLDPSFVWTNIHSGTGY